ncbi:MAG: hypothetical protein Tsb0021_09140 [Chlamydiales bacterium]
MDPLNGLFPFASLPEEDQLHVLSFLDESSLKAVACVNKHLKTLANDFQLWKVKAEREFGKDLTNSAKEPNKTWKQTYIELSSIKKDLLKNKDDIISRTNKAASEAFRFLTDLYTTQYKPNEQTGSLGGLKITVFKPSNQSREGFKKPL